MNEHAQHPAATAMAAAVAAAAKIVPPTASSDATTAAPTEPRPTQEGEEGEAIPQNNVNHPRNRKRKYHLHETKVSDVVGPNGFPRVPCCITYTHIFKTR